MDIKYAPVLSGMEEAPGWLYPATIMRRSDFISLLSIFWINCVGFKIAFVHSFSLCWTYQPFSVRIPRYSFINSCFSSMPMPGTFANLIRPLFIMASSANPPNGANRPGYDSLPPSPSPAAKCRENWCPPWGMQLCEFQPISKPWTNRSVRWRLRQVFDLSQAEQGQPRFGGNHRTRREKGRRAL